VIGRTIPFLAPETLPKVIRWLCRIQKQQGVGTHGMDLGVEFECSSAEFGPLVATSLVDDTPPKSKSCQVAGLSCAVSVPA